MLVADAEKGANATMTVDLEKQTVTRPDGEVVPFEIDPFRKHCLVAGLDEVGLTMTMADAIDDFERRRAAAHAWMN